MARVLVVDDNPDMALMLSRFLSFAGHETIRAYGGRQALNLLQIERPDIMLLDLMMPDIDGYETLRRLRKLPELDGLPVIVVTASADPDVAKRVLAQGANACLFKPLEADQLNREVEKHTHQK